MDYDLAKKLKDAGFTQGFDTHSGGKWIDEDGDVYNHQNGIEAESYIPTLEELIDACGDSFGELDNTFDGWRVHGSSKAPVLESDPVWAKTPTEAVARLWLALNSPK